MSTDHRAAVTDEITSLLSDASYHNEPWVRKMAILYFGTTNWQKVPGTNWQNIRTAIQEIAKYSVIDKIEGYETNVKFARGLMPLIKTAARQLYKKYAPKRYPKHYQKVNKALNAVKINIGHTKSLHQHMNCLTQNLWITRKMSAQKLLRKFKKVYQIKKSTKKCDNWSFKDMETLIRRTVWNGVYGSAKKVIVGGPSFVNPAFPTGAPYAWIFSSSLHILFHEVGHHFEKTLEKASNKVWKKKLNTCMTNMLTTTRIVQQCPKTFTTKQFSEATADAIGQALALHVYRSHYKKLDMKPIKISRNGKKYSMDQIFFIGFGSNSCGQDSQNLQKIFTNNSKNPKHIFGKVRYNLAVRTTDAFRKAFNCKKPALKPHNCILYKNAWAEKTKSKPKFKPKPNPKPKSNRRKG